MQGKIFGIPLILILLVVGIAALIDFPMYSINVVTNKRLDRMELMMGELISRTPIVVATPVPTPTVEATPTVKAATKSAVKK